MKNGLANMCDWPTEGRYSRQERRIKICRGEGFKRCIQSLRSPGQTHVTLPQRLDIYL